MAWNLLFILNDISLVGLLQGGTRGSPQLHSGHQMILDTERTEFARPWPRIMLTIFD